MDIVTPRNLGKAFGALCAIACCGTVMASNTCPEGMKFCVSVYQPKLYLGVASDSELTKEKLEMILIELRIQISNGIKQIDAVNSRHIIERHHERFPLGQKPEECSNEATAGVDHVVTWLITAQRHGDKRRYTALIALEAIEPLQAGNWHCVEVTMPETLPMDDLERLLDRVKETGITIGRAVAGRQ